MSEGESVQGDPGNGAPERIPLARMILVGLVGLAWPAPALLIAGVRARWAALSLMFPLLVAALFFVRFEHPGLLGYGMLALSVEVMAFQLGLLALALAKARSTPRRTRRERWVLAGQVLLFVVLTYAATTAIYVQRVNQLEPFRITSSSMLPTLLPGDHVVIDHRSVTPKRGDLIEYEPQPRNGFEPTGVWVSRAVAVEGDVVETRGHEVLVNGTALAHIDRPCAPGTSDPSGGRCVSETLSGGQSYGLIWREPGFGNWGPNELGPGEVFVLGDNRDNSLDSRHLGPVVRSQLRGRALAVWFSWGEGKVRWSRIGLGL